MEAAVELCCLRLRFRREGERGECTEQAVHDGARKDSVTLVLSPPPPPSPSPVSLAKPGPHLDQESGLKPQ